MPRVAFVTCVFPPYPGGIGIAAKGMAEAASRHGFYAEVFVPWQKKSAMADEFHGAIKVTELMPLVKYGNAAILPQLIWRLRSFDIIHLFYPFFGAAELLSIIKRTTKAKIIIHHIMDAVAEGWLGKVFSFHRRYFLPYILRQADLVLDMSEDFFKGSDFGATRSRWVNVPLDFLPLGVDTNKFTPSVSQWRETPVIIFVGGLDKAHYFKGIPVLLRSLGTLKKKGLKFRGIIIGDGDMKKNYEIMAGKLGLLGGTTTFGGLVANEKLPDYYRSADIFVMPSTARVESFCIAAAEAQACGLPVIVSDFPGVRATIENNVTGLTVRPGDIYDLSDKLAKLIRDSELRRSMGAKGRARMQQKYDWKVIGQKLFDIYLRITLK